MESEVAELTCPEGEHPFASQPYKCGECNRANGRVRRRVLTLFKSMHPELYAETLRQAKLDSA